MNKSIELVFFLVSLLGNLLCALVIGLSLVPGYFLVHSVWEFSNGLLNQFWSGVMVCISIGVAYYLFIFSLLILIVFFRQILWLKNKETEANIFSITGMRLGTNNLLISLAKHLALPLVRTSPVIVWFYRGMGAKIGKNTLISTTRIWDCDLLEIGENSVIGGNVAINGHITTSQGKGILRKVKIGSGVIIGADSMVFPGVTIEDNIIVGACSMIPKDAHLEANSVYAGVPVSKIR